MKRAPKARAAKSLPSWKRVGDDLQRIAVPGGWLYRHVTQWTFRADSMSFTGSGNWTPVWSAPCFVPKARVP